MILSLKSIKKKSFFYIVRAVMIYLTVIVNFLFFIAGGVGLFQIMVSDIIDAFIRSFGLFLITFSLFLYMRFIKKHKNRSTDSANLITHGFFEIVRHPEYLILFIFSFGLAATFISLGGLVVTFIQIPITIYLSISEEREIIKENENYFNYINETPMIIPELRTVLKKVL